MTDSGMVREEDELLMTGDPAGEAGAGEGNFSAARYLPSPAAVPAEGSDIAALGYQYPARITGFRYYGLLNQYMLP